MDHGRSHTHPTLPFEAAEAQARDRLVQLARAVTDLRESDSMWTLLRLIYDQSHDGLATWVTSVEVIAGHALGPRCVLSAVYKLIQRARHAGLVSTGGDRGVTPYAINWAGVYAIRGLPLPAELQRAASDTQVIAAPTPHSFSRGEIHSPQEKRILPGRKEFSRGELRRSHEPPRARPRVSCLVFLF